MTLISEFHSSNRGERGGAEKKGEGGRERVRRSEREGGRETGREREAEMAGEGGRQREG